MPVKHPLVALRANLEAEPAPVDADAARRVDPDFTPGADAFRIAAPPAPKGTPLEKNLCPDARPVMNGEMLDIEHHAFVPGGKGFFIRIGGVRDDDWICWMGHSQAFNSGCHKSVPIEIRKEEK
jgi:hypothetical protein